MPLQATSGAASYDAFGGGVAVVPAYIEDVFSTYLYTGTGAALTITNNIDLSTKGGLTWIKGRSGATGNRLTDTARGVTKSLESNSTAAEATESTGLTAFGTTGFTIGADADYNTSAATYASWTFRKQPKFFDIQTWTGNGTTQNIAHSLAGTVGTLIIKRTDTGGSNWLTYHRSLPADEAVALNTTEASSAYFTPTIFGNNTVSVAPTSTQFTVGNFSGVNASGGTYVAYLFAHDAGGFGLTGTDNVISCGSFTYDSTNGNTINLGYEPQFILSKDASSVTQWQMSDSMRGMTANGSTQRLFPNLSNAEDSNGAVNINATGFFCQAGRFTNGDTIIYIAIRRGPMKVPTTGTSVYNAIARTGTGAAATITGVGFAPDWWHCFRKTGSLDHPMVDRLRGSDKGLYSNLLQDEDSLGGNPTFSTTMDGVSLLTLTGGYYNGSGSPYINHFFKRAPSVFDICCYSGSGSATTQTHNLGAVPQLIIVKRRNTSGAWDCYSAFLANTDYLALSSANGSQTNTDRWNSTSPTSTVFTVGTSTTTNASGSTYVAYLFATAAGVSKCFSYTGNGSSQTINCGFTSSARFILIKRTDSTGDWYCWDTTRGIAAGNDPHISFNTTAAEVTTDDTIDTDSTGFVVNQLSATDVNVSSATYIGLAIA